MAARRRGLPGWLAWLGLVSYSVYLLHPLVIAGYTYLAGQVRASIGAQAFIAVGMVTVILAASAISYYGLEKPMQRLGRRVSARWGA
jgi:peptidoglycan/LPS O-acetylase OafA/YrhL